MQFQVLGPLRVVDREESLALGPPQQRRLLAVLLASPNMPWTVDRLVDELWGEKPPQSARHLIHVYVSRLRALLGDLEGRSRIERSGASYAVRVLVEELDSLRLHDLADEARKLAGAEPEAALELLEEATSLWRGTPFGDLASESDTLRAEAAQLTERYLTAMAEWIDTALLLGEHESLVGVLEALTTEHPYRERFWEQRMIALYRCGRQADALRSFRAARTVLADDLGVDPGPALEQCEMRILLHDPELLLEAPLPPGNLPIPLTSFVGRQREIKAIAALVDDSRLVSLTGPGGIGKTRLALAVARKALARFPGGVWWIDLAPIAGPGAVVEALAQTLSVMAQPNIPLLDAVVRSLAHKRVLLVIDNCEHVVAEVADAVVHLLGATDDVQVLATSRSALRVSAECVWAVPPMATQRIVDTAPDESTLPDALRLFDARATSANPNFELAGDTVTVATDICTRVDGIPLAIEMAAARVRVLAPAQILSSLADPLTLLKRNDRDVAERHHTLKAALDWSYELLGPDLQLLFDRLSVFTGDFDLRAMAAVACRTPVAHSALDALTELVEASLVSVVSVDGDAARYRLLAIVREYGSANLDSRGDGDAARDAHAEYFFDMLRRAGETTETPQFADWMPALSDAYADIQAALLWTLPRHPREGTLQVAPSLFHYWYRRGEPREAARWGKAMLEDATDVSDRLLAAACKAVAFGATILGEPEEARRHMDEALLLYRRAGEQSELVNALFGRGNAAIQTGDFGTAHDCAIEALAICDELGDRWRRVGPLSLLAFTYLFSGGPLDEARALAEEALHLNRELGDTGSQVIMNPLSVIAMKQGDLAGAERYALDSATIAAGTGWEAAALANLAEVYLAQGNLDSAQATLERAVTRALEAGLENWFRISLRDLSQVAAGFGNAARAALLIGASRRNMPHYGLDPAIYEPIERELSEHLGPKRFSKIADEGFSMEHRDLVSIVLDAELVNP